MSTLSDLQLLQTLLALLPGFLTAAIVGAFVLREERSIFERLVQALIYTFLAHVLWTALGRFFPTNATSQLMGLAGCAVFWGVILTWAINTGTVHDLLRWCGLTQAGSRPTEWYDVFYRKEEYVILHLKDGRRIFGWPDVYPERADKGHILLEDAQWLHGDRDESSAQQVDYLISVTDVRFVEFIPPRKKEFQDA